MIISPPPFAIFNSNLADSSMMISLMIGVTLSLVGVFTWMCPFFRSLQRQNGHRGFPRRLALHSVQVCVIFTRVDVALINVCFISLLS
jgi:uncharacterized membrane protein YhdT